MKIRLKMKRKNPISEELIAPCGMSCAICSNYLSYINNLKQSPCKGCRPGNKKCEYLFKKCTGINNNLKGNANALFCFECNQYPCKQINRMDRRYRNNYKMSIKDNLEYIKKMGIGKFIIEQYKKYSCTKCDGLISIHNRKCFKCDEITRLVEKEFVEYKVQKESIVKHEWRRKEKPIYLPKNKPEIITLPAYKFFMIEGKGNPNDDFFAENIAILYSLSYGVRMSPKAGVTPDGYFEYTVYPLEGIWDISEQAKENYNGKFDKDSLVFKLMIRQPDFVTEEFAKETIEKIKKKKPHELLDRVTFGILEEGQCVQMMHIGSYDNEPESFKKMEEFCEEKNLKRISETHKEIYLTDARKVAPEKLVV